MMPATDWTGLSGLALVWMLLILRLPIVMRLAPLERIVFVVAVYCLAMMPVSGLSLAGFLRGITGDLSIPSLLLLITALFTGLRRSTTGATNGFWKGRERDTQLVFLNVLSLCLYPFALGIGRLDPYRLGFASVVLIIGMALVSLWGLYRHLVLLPLSITLAVLAWSQGWYESTNLWDYLIDVPLAIYSIGAVSLLLLNKIARGKRA